MSFDIFFQPCRFSEKADADGELHNDPLNARELKAVNELFARHCPDGPDDQGCHTLQLRDGGEADIYGEDVANGCMVALQGITRELVGFLFELLRAGNWVMLPTTDEGVAITTAPDSLKGIPEDFPEVATCGSADELGRLLAEGFAAWEESQDESVNDDE